MSEVPSLARPTPPPSPRPHRRMKDHGKVHVKVEVHGTDVGSRARPSPRSHTTRRDRETVGVGVMPASPSPPASLRSSASTGIWRSSAIPGCVSVLNMTPTGGQLSKRTSRACCETAGTAGGCEALSRASESSGARGFAGRWGGSISNRRVVRLSAELAAAPVAVLLEVLCHEIAHLAVRDLHGRCQPHGPEWAALVRAAGFKPRRRIPWSARRPSLDASRRGGASTSTTVRSAIFEGRRGVRSRSGGVQRVSQSGSPDGSRFSQHPTRGPGMTDPACPFCSPADDRLFHRGRLVLGLWDQFPVSPGHALIIPRRHVASWFEATDEERVELMAAVADARAAIEQSPSARWLQPRREHRPRRGADGLSSARPRDSPVPGRCASAAWWGAACHSRESRLRRPGAGGAGGTLCCSLADHRRRAICAGHRATAPLAGAGARRRRSAPPASPRPPGHGRASRHRGRLRARAGSGGDRRAPQRRRAEGRTPPRADRRLPRRDGAERAPCVCSTWPPSQARRRARWSSASSRPPARASTRRPTSCTYPTATASPSSAAPTCRSWRWDAASSGTTASSRPETAPASARSSRPSRRSSVTRTRHRSTRHGWLDTAPGGPRS